MNKINKLLQKYQDEYLFDDNDFAFYDDFCKNSSKEQIDAKYNQFLTFFKSFEKHKEAQKKKVTGIKKGAERELSRNKNKSLISKIEELKSLGFSRSEISEKLGISKRRIHSLHCINTFLLRK